MDYKQKYEEALERCRKVFNFNNLAYSHEEIRQRLESIFPELRESEDERIRKELINFFSKGAEHDSSTNGIKDRNIIAWLEKQGEQKSADKVEPKFKVGDWVRAISSGNIFKILSVNDGLYRVLCYDGIEANYPIEDVEKDLAYWTIQDANDGDVLTDKQNCTCIFREIMTDDEEGTFVDAYFGIDIDNEFVTNEKGEIWTVPEDLFPATKEQRDLLFQKMREAGYEWNAEKKELKKIENNPAWSEEDEWKRNELLQYLKEKGDYRSTWYSWLKSPKPHWKPTEEQMEAFRFYLGGNTLTNEEYAHLRELYNNLESL